ncbi:MAG: hypothetical protein WDO69_15400 [Pseudomonadota bacterium]
MKFARGLVVASVIAACVPLAAACGSAPDDLFSQSGEGSGYAGANDARAGASAAGGKQDGMAGSSNSSGGKRNGGDAGESNGSSGAPAGGMDSGEGGKTGDAGEAGAGAPHGGTAGASAGGAGSAGASVGGAGASGASVGGAGAGGAGAGGAGAGGASVGGAGAGGAGAGGESVGGAGGASGAAGAGGTSCPALAPVDKADCSVSTPSSCFYSGVACSCLASSQGPSGMRKWACYGTPEKCPNLKPTAGNSCKQNIGAECPYPNQDYCICKGDAPDASWVCQAPSATCLTNKPAQNLACGPVRTCQYSDVSCFCNASNWSCLGG